MTQKRTFSRNADMNGCPTPIRRTDSERLDHWHRQQSELWKAPASPIFPHPRAYTEETGGSSYWELPRLSSRIQHSEGLTTMHSSIPRSPASLKRLYGSAPTPPPFRFQENGPRPSLPPLRVVLGDSLTSPPPTPSSGRVSFQPSPREPIHDFMTYKPAALYPHPPHKRSRTNIIGEWTTPQQTSSRSSPDSLPSLTTASSTSPARRRMSGVPQYPELDQSEQVQHYEIAARDSHVSTRAIGPHDEKTNLAPRQDHLPAIRQAPRWAQEEPRPMSSLPERRELRHVHRELHHRDAVSQQAHYPAIKPESTIYARPARTEQQHQPSTSTTLTTRHPAQSSREAAPAHVQSSRPREEPTHPNGQDTPASESEPAYFVPSLYMYQNGKSRKRSNLPKQSTDIMKHWFDEHMHNPYPTEEQKKHFAAVAGINLTQVSNWFINHRRRCPELKEKRDKSHDNSPNNDYY